VTPLNGGRKKTAPREAVFLFLVLALMEGSQDLQGPVGHLQHANQFLGPEASKRIHGDSLI
jgi:hypothetical protein